MRAVALNAAVDAAGPRPGAGYFGGPTALARAVIDIADEFLIWLRRTGEAHRVRVYAAVPQDEGDSTNPERGSANMAALNTGQKVLLTADPEDAAGFDVDVPVTYTVDDPSVVTLVPVEDNPKAVWAVSGAPGSAVVTATVTNLAGEELTGTLAVDVVPADVAVVKIDAGEPEAE